MNPQLAVALAIVALAVVAAPAVASASVDVASAQEPAQEPARCMGAVCEAINAITCQWLHRICVA